MAGLFEITTGFLCYRMRYSHIADLVVVVLLVLLLWYRWGLTLLGVSSRCGCSGYWGYYWGWSAYQESVFAKLGLLAMVSCLIPAGIKLLYQHFRKSWVRHVFIGSAILMHSRLFASEAAEVFTVSGNLTVQRPIARGSRTKVEKNCSYSFRCSGIGNWSLESTNSESPFIWSKAYYISNTLYYLQPSIGGVDSNNGLLLADTNLVLASVSRGPLIMLPHDDYCEIGALWTTFCSGAAYDNLGLSRDNAPWPIPMWHARINLKAWGFRWKFGTQVGNSFYPPFFQSIKAVRDIYLDMPSFEEDLRRPELIYPQNVQDREMMLGTRDTLYGYTNGANGMTFVVESWGTINGISYPMTSRVRLHSGGPNNATYREILISANYATISRSVSVAAPPVTVRTGVTDYRYGRKSRQRQYVAATYVLDVGQSWPQADDQRLLARAESFMLRGPTFRSYRYNTIHYLLWAGFILIAVLPTVIIFKSYTNKYQRANFLNREKK